MMETKMTKRDNNKRRDMRPELKFKINESYKTIRTNIAFSLLKKGCKKIVISSSSPGEGKSTIAVNVAISLAKTDARVLLIDTDLRSPRVHLFLDLASAPGVTDYLGGINKMEEILHETNYPNLQVLCAGSLSPNPSELLSSDYFKSMLTGLEKGYDYIIIDSAPLSLVSDPLPVIKLSDGVILVVRERVTTQTELKRTIHSLELVNAKILGFIYNRKTYTKRRLKKTSSYSAYYK